MIFKFIFCSEGMKTKKSSFFFDVIPLSNVDIILLQDQIFVKGYDFFSFAKNMCKTISKSISKNRMQKI